MKRRVAASVALAAIAVAGLAGCATIDEFAFHEKELSYETYDDAPQKGDLAFVPAPFIPDDATDISIRTETDDTGKLVRFTSESGIDPDDCTPGTITGAPPITASWWPAELPVDGLLCGGGAGDYQAFEVDGVTYAFRK